MSTVFLQVMVILCISANETAFARFIDAGKTTSSSTTTITGPQGTRTISSQSNGSYISVPGYESSQGHEDIETRGVTSTGVVLQQTNYYGGVPTVQHLSEGDSGNVHREYQTERRSIPSINIRVKP